jgi:hypothetical protein
MQGLATGSPHLRASTPGPANLMSATGSPCPLSGQPTRRYPQVGVAAREGLARPARWNLADYAERPCGTRYPANGGGRVDFEGPAYVGQVKHVRRLSLAALEALAVEVADIGTAQGKTGVVIVKRRAGIGCPTTRLVVMTDATFQRLADRVTA